MANWHWPHTDTSVLNISFLFNCYRCCTYVDKTNTGIIQYMYNCTYVQSDWLSQASEGPSWRACGGVWGVGWDGVGGGIYPASLHFISHSPHLTFTLQQLRNIFFTFSWPLKDAFIVPQIEKGDYFGDIRCFVAILANIRFACGDWVRQWQVPQLKRVGEPD